MSIEVLPVSTSVELNRFIRFPEQLYRNEPRWAPPLWSEEARVYSPKHNPVLRESDFQLFVAYRNGELVGRILAYVNHLWNAHYQTRSGMFGAYEAVDDPAVAAALMQGAEDWLRSQDCEEVIGPMHPVDEVFGFLVDGFEQPGIFLTPWNLPLYNQQMTFVGYSKLRDLLAYEIDARDSNYQLEQRYVDFHDHFLARHPDYTIRCLDLKKLDEDAAHIWRISNCSLIYNWGFLPANYDIFQDNLRRLKTVVDCDAVWFVEYKGKPVGFCLGYPDLNVIIRKIKGRLLPFGWLRLLTGIKKIKNFRLFGLAVDPHFHGRGLDALLYVHLTQAMAPRHIRLEANWVLEENIKMNNSLQRLGMRPCRRYRIYQKPL